MERGGFIEWRKKVRKMEAKKSNMQCEADGCDVVTWPLYFSAAHDGLFVCAWCVDINSFTPATRAEVLAQREGEGEMRRAA